MSQVLDAKLADCPAAIALVLLDLILVTAHLVVYLQAVGNLEALTEHDPPRGVLASLGLITIYFALREGFQLRTMTKLGLGRVYWNDTWNMIDCIGVVFTFIVIGFASQDEATRTSPGFRIFAAVGSIPMWLKFLGAIRVLNIKLATFIFSLNMIMKDLTEFMIVTAVVMVMFAEMHFIIHADIKDLGEAQGDLDLTDDKPFHSPAYAMLSIFMMMFGQFERDWFQAETKSLTAFSITLFLIYMFFVVIVMLNVLIAIVSDSYDVRLVEKVVLVDM
jgi:hypothetical protein